jgi:hypothetical protein
LRRDDATVLEYDLSGLAIGAYNPAFAALLAANKKAADQAGTQSAAAATSDPGANLAQSSAFSAALAAAASSGVSASSSTPSTPATVPAADASAGARDSGAGSAVQDFLNYANESPGQKLMDSILKSMGLTEDDLKHMPPDKLKAVEATIQQKIKEAAEEAAQKGKTGVIANVTA